MLNNGVLYGTRLARLDGLRAVQPFSGEPCAWIVPIGSSPIMLRINGASAMIFEQDSIRELMLQSCVGNASILDRLAQINPAYRAKGWVLEFCVGCHFQVQIVTYESSSSVLSRRSLQWPVYLYRSNASK